MGIAPQTLNKNGLRKQAKALRGQIAGSGVAALHIIPEDVNITSPEDAMSRITDLKSGKATDLLGNFLLAERLCWIHKKQENYEALSR